MLLNQLFIALDREPVQMTIDLLNRMKPLQGKSKDISIGIKPNLVCASPANEVLPHILKLWES